MKKERNPNWGGFRENAGRKHKFENDSVVTMSFTCSSKQRDEIRKLVKESGLKLSDWIITKLL